MTPSGAKRMYRLDILPVGRHDMIEIVMYISNELNNPDAATQLAIKLTEAADSIPAFPYANPAYMSIKPLMHEYRKLRVDNFILFYWVDEDNQTVTVARVVYARRDLDKQL